MGWPPEILKKQKHLRRIMGFNMHLVPMRICCRMKMWSLSILQHHTPITIGILKCVWVQVNMCSVKKVLR